MYPAVTVVLRAITLQRIPIDGTDSEQIVCQTSRNTKEYCFRS